MGGLTSAGWQNAFRRLSLAYGWGPQEIGDMTPAQVCAYLEQNGACESQTRWMHPAEARALAARLRAAQGAGAEEIESR